MLEMNHVTFGYKRSVNVLEDFSLSLESGAVYGLLGKNGTGKSTLLYLLSGLLRAQQGSVFFKGKDVRRRLPETLGDLFLLPEELVLPNVTLKLCHSDQCFVAFAGRTDEWFGHSLQKPIPETDSLQYDRRAYHYHFYPSSARLGQPFRPFVDYRR